MPKLTTILCVMLCSICGSAQLPAPLPSAPSAQSTLSMSASEMADRKNAETQKAPETTIFPHSDTAPWWISGQTNIIFQAHPPFHSPYQGQNSFHGAGEYKTSLVGTLFLGYQPHRDTRYNTDFIVDFESAGGRGLSQALGLAGFTNLDVVRNPNLGSKPYLARGEIHQTIGLASETTDSTHGPFSLATQVPVRRLEFRIGKMSMPDVFDINSVGSDSHLQFTNWTVDNNGAWDYAADTRGYTVAAIAEYDDRNWSARYGLAAMPTVANGLDLDWAFSARQWPEYGVRAAPLIPARSQRRHPYPQLRQPRAHGNLSRSRRRLPQRHRSDARNHPSRPLRRREIWLRLE